MNRDWLLKQLKNGILQTPCYVFNQDELRLHIGKIKQCTENFVELCYAMKANPFLIQTMSEEIGKIEVCSPGELEICKSRNIPPQNIIYSGVNKTRDNIESALQYGVTAITVESLKHWKLLQSICKEKNYNNVYILPRLTSGTQFGMDEQDLLQVMEEAVSMSQFQIYGIHYFSGTQKKNRSKISDELDMLNSFMIKLEKRFHLKNLMLEYGAGLYVPYFDGEDFDGIYDNLMDVVNEIVTLQQPEDRKYRVTLELGRYLAFSCGTYLTKVEDMKKNNGHCYVIVDGGIHQLNYYGQNMAMRVPEMELLQCTENREKENVAMTICGSLCTTADILVRKWSGLLPCEGDYFAFYNTGAYSITESPALFLSRSMPAVYAYSRKNGLEITRPVIESYDFNGGNRVN